MANHVWGYWDCIYCQEKAIRGDIRACPKCGAPVQSDTKFYMLNNVPHDYVNDAEKNDAANWICDYCGSQNIAANINCSQCGSPKGEAKTDYFTRPKPTPPPQPNPAQPPVVSSPPVRSHDGLKRLKGWGIFLLIAAFLVWLFFPITRTAGVISFQWERSIFTETFSAVDESGWSLPNKAHLDHTKEEIHHYDSVLDHYEERSRQVPHEVLDGYDTSYRDLGNGEFEEIQTPRYRTEYETEYYDEPVYVQIPVYQTKYYYTVDKWVEGKAITASGNDHDPKWPETDLPKQVDDPEYGDQRQGRTSARYMAEYETPDGSVQLKEYSYDEWTALKVGDGVTYQTFRFSKKPLD